MKIEYSIDKDSLYKEEYYDYYGEDIVDEGIGNKRNLVLFANIIYRILQQQKG